MKRATAALLCLLILVGCGHYRIAYQMPSRLAEAQPPIKKGHSHGIGPLIVGGGGFFFLFSQISPALIDYTGTMRVSEVCPDGIAEVSHRHSFGQNAMAAFISWLLIVNWYQRSDVNWRCAAAPESKGGMQAPASTP